MKTHPDISRRSAMLALAGLLAALLGAGTAVAVPQAAFEGAFRHFTAAAAGDSAEVDPASKAFAELLAAEPANPVLMAYAGASLAMKARTTMLPWKKLDYAEDGLAQLDKALAMLTPAHDTTLLRGTAATLEVRYVAANTFLAVPAFMHRGALGAKLLGEVLASPQFAAAPLAFKGQVWMRAAALASQESRPKDARQYLDQVIAAGAPQAAAARAMLKEIPA